MQSASLKGQSRRPGNRHANRRLRAAGLVPGVIYGHRRPPETVAVSLHDLRLALDRLQHVVPLEVDGRRQQYLIKDVQYDHLQQLPIHVDLMRVDPNERVQVKVPVELRGEPHGVHEGGVLVQVLADLEVECPLLNIPEAIRPNVGGLGVGQALRVRDIELPAGVSPRHQPEEIIATVRAKRGVEVAAEELEQAGAEAAGAEPDVIGRKASEQAEQAARE